jgi:LysM repeat protein
VLVVIARGAGWVGQASSTTTTRSKPRTTTTPKAHKPKPKTQRPPVERLRYKVQAGDTFSTIATRFHTTVELLQTLNPGVDSSQLTIGQSLRVR